MRFHPTFLIWPAAAFMLSSCDTKDRAPLPGTREPFIMLEQGLTIEKDAKNPIHVPAAQRNANWPQVGGNAQHAMPPAVVADKPTLVWKASMGQGTRAEQRLIANIVVHDGVIYGMDAQGVVYALKAADGTVLWTQDTTPTDAMDEPLGGGVGMGGGILYATTSFGDVIALSPQDGKELWRQNLKTPIRTAPTIEGGKVYVVNISNETTALNAADGATLWTHSGILEPAALLGGASPAVQDDAVIITYSSGEIYALHTTNGQMLWADTLTPTIRTDTVSGVPHIRARPVIEGNQVFVVSHAGRMAAIDLKAGTRQWQKPISGVHTPAVAGNALFVQTKQNDVLCLNRHTGAIQWVAALPALTTADKEPIFWAGPVLVNDLLVFTSSTGEVRFLKALDGQVAHRLTFNDGAFLSPVVADGTLYVLSDNGEIYAWK